MDWEVPTFSANDPWCVTATIIYEKRPFKKLGKLDASKIIKHLFC